MIHRLDQSTGTSTFGLCMDCHQYHGLGYGCPSSLAVPPPTIQFIPPDHYIDHVFVPVLMWVGGLSELAGFVCQKCAEYRPVAKPDPIPQEEPEP